MPLTLQTHDDPPDHGIRVLSYEELKARGIRFSRVWIAKLIRENKFPRPINIGVSHVGFVESEINEWLAAKVRERDEAQQPAQ
jgi:prophage regulatory protein